jgi:hypothetical protein
MFSAEAVSTTQRMAGHFEQPKTCPSCRTMWGKLVWMKTGRICLAGAAADSTAALASGT